MRSARNGPHVAPPSDTSTLRSGWRSRRAARDQLGDGPLAAVGGLDVVEDRAARDRGSRRRGRRWGRAARCRCGSRAPSRSPRAPPTPAPTVVVPVAAPSRRRDREERRLEAEVGGPVDLGDRVVDVEQRDRRRAARSAGERAGTRTAQSLMARAAGREQLRGPDRRRPDPDRRVDDLGPDALLVEVVQSQVRVVGARRPLVERVAVAVRERGGRAAGCRRRNCLAVDVDRLVRPSSSLTLRGIRSASAAGKAVSEQVVGLDEVRIARVRPDLADLGLVVHACTVSGFVVDAIGHTVPAISSIGAPSTPSNPTPSSAVIVGARSTTARACSSAAGAS